MSKKLTDKRLNESQRCKIISKLSKTNPPSKRALASEYDVSEGAIWKGWEKRDSILDDPLYSLKKLSRRPSELQLDDLSNLKICCTSGLTACVVPGSLYRHLSPLRKRKVLLLHYPFLIQTLRLHGNGLVVSGHAKVYRKCFFMLRLTKMTHNYYQR